MWTNVHILLTKLMERTGNYSFITYINYEYGCTKVTVCNDKNAGKYSYLCKSPCKL